VRAKIFIGEALRSLSGNISTTVAATLTVLIGIFLLGLFIALGSWVLSWSDSVEQQLEVRVFFELDATPKQINRVGDQLAALPEASELTFVSREEALERMEREFPELVANLSSNPLPDAYEVKPGDADDVETIAVALEPLPPGVESVSFPRETTERVREVASVIEFVFLSVSVVLLIASTILIANTIRLSIFARRREIEVMKLVGASNWFVRGPFMLEGLICGLFGSIAAIILLFLGKEFALPKLIPDSLGSDGGVHAWSFELVALILLGCGLLLGAAGAGITLRRFLRV
jgi:cell division transport system permease protein